MSVLLFLCMCTLAQAWGLNKVMLLKDQLKPLAQKLHQFVQQEELAAMLVQLKLVDPEDLPPPSDGRERCLTSTTFFSPKRVHTIFPLLR